MITEKMQLKLLRVLYKKHREKYGESKYNLADTSLYTTSGPSLINHVPGIKVREGNLIRYLTVVLAQELERKGLVEFSSNGMEFYLTVLGYEEAGLSKWGQVRRSLNSNGGTIAACSMIIALLALVVATKSLIAASEKGGATPSATVQAPTSHRPDSGGRGHTPASARVTAATP